MSLSKETVKKLNYQSIIIFIIEFFCCLAGFSNLSYYEQASLAAIKAVIWFLIAYMNVNLGWSYCQKMIKEEIENRGIN